MVYKKIVEMVPVEKRETLSDKLLNLLLKTKNEACMSSSMANCFLSQWRSGSFYDVTGLAVLLEATAMVELEQTVEYIEKELLLADVASALKKAAA